MEGMLPRHQLFFPKNLNTNKRTYITKKHIISTDELTEDQEGSISDRHGKGNADIQQHAETGQNSQASGNDAEGSHPYLVPYVVQPERLRGRQSQGRHTERPVVSNV